MNRPTALAVPLTVLALTLGLAGCGDDEPAPTASDTRTGGGRDDSRATEPGTPSPADPTSAETTASGGTATVPVYFVASTPQGPRLFREFQKVPADNPMAEAAALMTAGDALDPDYGTLYPAGSFASVEENDDAGAIVVQLADDAWTARPDGMSKREAKLAAQQLVYTAQGVAQERLPVLVQQGSDPVPLFGIDTTGGLTAAPQLDVLGLVNVTSPEQGASVSGTFTASGVASSFEATVPWEVRDAGGEVVLDGFATADGWMDKLYPWETEVDVSSLPPGSYEFVAMTDDPSGGEGAGPTEDSKEITVG